MKTIEVSDEVYDFLKDCQNELKTQDNRCTRNPLYTVWEKKRVYGLDDNYAEEYEFLWDCSTFSKKEIVEYLSDNGYDEELLDIYKEIKEISYDFDGDSDEIEITDKELKEIKDYFNDEMNSSYDLERILQKCVCNDIYTVNYKVEDFQVVNGGCFSFFEKDAYDHIKMNGHNMGMEPYTYADSLYRTPRMERLLEVLTSEINFNENKGEK